MTNLTPQKEQQILEALAAKFALCAENVITDDDLLDSEHDLIGIATVKNVDEELEIRYCKLDFLKYEDSATDGCDDMPVVYLTYGAHLFFGHNKKRSDNSEVKAEAKKTVLDLRNKFLEPNRLIMPGVEHETLKQISDLVDGDDRITGYYGYPIDLTVRVVVE